jgi:hypothetical protein
MGRPGRAFNTRRHHGPERVRDFRGLRRHRQADGPPCCLPRARFRRLWRLQRTSLTPCPFPQAGAGE